VAAREPVGEHVVNGSEVNGVSAPPRTFLERYRTPLIWLVAILAVALMVAALVRHRPPTMAGGPGMGRGGQNGPVAVAVATVTPGDIQIRIPALGTVTTLANVTVRTQISGTLQKILFTEGQIVHAGDVLAQIDPRPYEAALQTAEGNLSATKRCSPTPDWISCATKGW